MIALLLANGFEEAEALVPCDFLRRAGLDVRLVSIYDTPKVTGGHGICVQCDLCLKELGDLPQAVILPGGLGGVQELAASPACQKLVKDCYRAQGVIGAICAAPTLLSAWGLTDDQLERYRILVAQRGNRDYLFADNIYANPSEVLHYDIPGEALSDVRFARMVNEAEKCLGYPYVWGGASPSTSFDCSGFVSWVINHCGNGWNYGRLTA